MSSIKEMGTFWDSIATPQKATIRFQVNYDITTDQEQDIEFVLICRSTRTHCISLSPQTKSQPEQPSCLTLRILSEPSIMDPHWLLRTPVRIYGMTKVYRKRQISR